MAGAQQAARRPVAAHPDELYDRAEPHWWPRLTSSGWDTPDASLEEREMTRRSRLLSWIVLGIVACALLLAAGGLRDPATLIAAGATVAGSLVVLALNRAGFVSAAATLLVVLVIGALAGAVVNAPGHLLDTVYLPAYDLLAVAVIIAASVMPRGAAFVVAAINIGFICGDFFIQPKGDDLLKWQAANGALWLLARPIALQVIVAVVAYLSVRGENEALRRADRAEEFAALERAFAEQRRQLEIGVQQILETHVRAANGDYGARAPLNEDNLLWQIAASLNNLLSRLQRSGGAEHQLRRTEEELRRLAAAMDDSRLGRRPFWPAPAGTAADLILERLPAARAVRQATGRLPAIPAPYRSQAPHVAPARPALNPPSSVAPAFHHPSPPSQVSAHLPAFRPGAVERAHPSGQLGQLPTWLRELMADSNPALGKASAPTPAVTSPTPAPDVRSYAPPAPRGQALPHVAPPSADSRVEIPTTPLAATPIRRAPAPSPDPPAEVGEDWPLFLRSIAAGSPPPDGRDLDTRGVADADTAEPEDTQAEE